MIAGIFKRKKSSIDLRDYQEIIESTLNQFKKADKLGSYIDDAVILTQMTMYNSPQSKYEHTPLIEHQKQLVVLFWGRLTNRDELACVFDISREELKKTSDQKLTFLSYLKWKDDLTKHIYGDYSAIIYSQKENRLYCFVDHMAVKPFYYYCDDKIFVFSSTLTLFHRFNLFPINPRLEWAAKYMLHLSMDFEDTAYDSIFKIPPANQIILDKEKFRKEKYFSFDPDKRINYQKTDDYIEEYKELLINAVKTRIDSDYKVGSENSGGIDSSTITSIAAKYFNQSIENLYTFGFAKLEDEPKFILQTSQKYNINNNYIFCGRNNLSLEIKNRSLDAMGYPYEHGNSTYHNPFYMLCEKNNIRTLLSGFGGDEFVTSIHGDIAIKEMFYDKKYNFVYSRLNGNILTSFLRLLKHFYSFKFKSNLEYSPRFLKAWKKRWPYFSIKDEIIQRFSLKEKYFDQARFDAGYVDLNKFTLEKRFVPFVPTRMNNCTQMAHSYGVDYAWPLLDVRLIDFFLSIPTEHKFNKISRYFHRLVCDELVPKGVNWKKSKWMGSPISATNIKTNLDLAKNLHKDLYQILDIDRLKENINNSSNSKDRLTQFTISKSIANINNLDLWFKTFYPDGSNW
ncbi:MAG: asparagine synthase-related protein [Pseudomonadota bacterium]